MSVTMDHQSEIIYKGTKAVAERTLSDMSFDMRQVTIEKKEWRTFQTELSRIAAMLVREINRSQKNFSSVVPEDLMGNFEVEGNRYLYGFTGDNGAVTFYFERDTEGIIRFAELKEELFEETYSLLF